MATGDVLVYFMPKNGQELNNIANPHWAAPGLHDRDKGSYLDIYAQRRYNLTSVIWYFNLKTKRDLNKTAENNTKWTWERYAFIDCF